jgi:PAS domain S-box-containing protein
MAPNIATELEERVQYLQQRLDEAEETLRALRSGEVDAVVASGPDGDRVYTLEGADQPYRVMVQNMAEGALTCMPDGLILFANQRLASILGMPLDRVIGSSIYNFVAEEDAPLLLVLLADRVGVQAEVRLKKGESAVPAQISANALSFDGIECACIIVTDLSELRRAEESLRRYSAQLAETNEDLKLFTQIVSHDLRAPLMNLRGFFSQLRDSIATLNRSEEVLLANLREAERAAVAHELQVAIPEALGFIESSVTRIDHLTGALLRLSRAGHRELQMEELDAGTLLQETLGSLAHQIESRHITVQIGPLPRIISDRSAIEQIFGNLLDNAIKYLDPERPGRIEVSAEGTVDAVVFHVRDNGRGIAEDDMRKVFAPFRRAGTEDVPGEGMGLAFVRALLHRLGGRIECHSQLGAGTTFSVILPKAS